jgi:16S rRNA (guanine(1405)-N(7))-methyltransferase
MKFDEATLETLVSEITSSAKYRHLSPDLIKRIGAQELTNRASLKLAIQETRSRLHQNAGAYLDALPPYSRWISALQTTPETERQELLLQWMRCHASTRERLPLLTSGYKEVFSALGPVASVLDIACGLHPLTLPFTGLPTDTPYFACDLYADMMQFLQSCYATLGWNGTFFCSDAFTALPDVQADVAAILKFLPVVEQNRRGSTLLWLQGVPAQRLLISFPTASLSGKSRGMAQNYEDRFLETIAPTGWSVQKILCPGELFFIVNK